MFTARAFINLHCAVVRKNTSLINQLQTLVGTVVSQTPKTRKRSAMKKMNIGSEGPSKKSRGSSSTGFLTPTATPTGTVSEDSH